MTRETHSSNKNVAVIGGGLAGLAAASALSAQGISVSVFEAAPQLGGRARSVQWNGIALDNGQHILLGAYEQTLNLMHKVGLNANQLLLRQRLHLNIHRAIHLKSWSLLPAPLNLLMGLLCCRGLSFKDRFKAISFFRHLRKIDFKLQQDIPLKQLLIQFKQSGHLIESLWEPLCLAALNTPIEIASAQIYLNILKDSFNQKKTDSDLLLPRVDLSQLLAQPLATFIKAHHGKIMLGKQIDVIESNQKGFTVNDTQFSHVILAVSPFSVSKVTQRLNQTINLEEITQFRHEPIYTIYLQYPSNVKLPEIMIGFTQSISQWVFDRGQLNGQTGLLAVVISASGRHQSMAQDELAQQVILELKSAFPDLPAPFWYKVIAEKRATFACTANLKRPHQKTSVSNLYLAGDYTEGDYPATIEGAIRSGISASQFILQS